MIYILFSADYELYFGGNYLPEREVLITQTNKLANICDKINVPITLFCDVLCLWRYRELGFIDFPNEVEGQLKDIISNGNDVQAHIHPHWNTLKINNNNYEIDLNTYLLGNLGKNRQECYKIILNILLKTKIYLENVLKKIDQNYKCLAYRAGGYGLQPNEDLLIEALENSGYLIDSSVVPGMFYKSKFHNIDFRNTPNLANYFISKEYCLKRPSDRGIFEIPIPGGNASIISLVNSLINKIKINKKKKIIRGYSIVNISDDTEKSGTFLIKLIKIIIRTIDRKGWHFLEIGDDDKLLIELTRKYINKYYTTKEDIYFSVSCHPKALTDSSFLSIEKYFAKINQLYGDNVQTITFQQAAEKIFPQEKANS